MTSTTKTAKTVTMQHIWKKLSSINVTKFTKVKNNLSYLPWSDAVALTMEHFPTMKYNFQVWTDSNGIKQMVNMVPASRMDEKTGTVINGFTGIVACTVEIDGNTRDMVLPIMTGYKNSAVFNPTSRDITDALMRCLTKCLAMFGLGHHLYTGEELPKQYGDDTATTKVVAPTKPKAPTGNSTKRIPLIQPVTTAEEPATIQE